MSLGENMTDNNVPEVVSPFKIDPQDKHKLDLAKVNRELTLAKAQHALAENEKAELSYNLQILNIYLKYGLSLHDSLNVDTGEVIRKTEEHGS